MKKPPASSEEAKMDFLSRHESALRECPATNLHSLAMQLGAEMKKAGLYSAKTVVFDISTGILRRAREQGWIVEKFRRRA